MLTGNDTGSLPPGLTLPNSTSAVALPACTPGNHASRMAGDLAATLVRVSGRPLNSTTVNGLPSAATRLISSCSWPGRSMLLRDVASPLISRVSPSASTIWSADWAAATAWSNPGPTGQSSAGLYCGGSVFGRSQAFTNVVFGSCALMPVYRLTASWSRPVPHHGPSMSCWSSPSGPITATDLVASSGSALLSFFSNTIDLLAAERSAATASGSSWAASAFDGST